MRRWQIWAGAGVAVMVAGLALWMALAPGWAVAALQARAQEELGRDLEVAGGAHLEFSPQLAIRFDGVRLSAGAGHEDALLTAPSLTLPIGFGQLLARDLAVSEAYLAKPEIALLIDDRGDASFAFPSPKTPAALSLVIDDGELRYFDARNGQALGVKGARLTLSVSREGETSIAGTVEINGRLARVEAFARSLPRIHGGGSPFDLNLETPDLDLVFNGRLSTARVLSLNGTAAAGGPDLQRALKWAGIDTGRDSGEAFSISGALDTAGRGFALKQAQLSLGANKALGAISIDARNAVPKFEAVLDAETFDLAPFIPASGATSADWGRNPLGFGALRSLDAAISLKAGRMSYGPLSSGPAEGAVTIEAGKLTARLSLQQIAQGSVELQSTIDASSLPPFFSLAVRADKVEAQQLLSPFGLEQLSGTGTVAASVSGSGYTQQEIAGSLKGDATLALTDGALTGADARQILAEASQRIVEGWTGGKTGFASLTASLSLADGTASLASFALDSATLKLSARGDIDLLRRAVDLSADPRLLTGDQTFGLPVALIVKGPWAKPRIYPDVPDILADSDKGFAALKAMAPAGGN